MGEPVSEGPRRGRGGKQIGTAVALASVLALLGCTAAPAPTPSDDVTNSPSGLSSLDLIGLWRVTEAEGAGPDTWLAMDYRFLTVWTPCDALSGSWESDGARLLAEVTSGFGPCLGESLEPEPWFAAIRGVEAADDGSLRLLGATGDPVAVLTPDAAPGPFDFGENGMREVSIPVVTEEARAREAEPAPLDPDLVPIDDETLAGRWVLADYAGSGDPYAIFRSEGSYEASDGCNEVRGPLLVNEGGRIRAGWFGFSTDIGCDNVDLPQWIVDTTRAGIDPQNGELVLVGPDGSESARLVRTE